MTPTLSSALTAFMDHFAPLEHVKGALIHALARQPHQSELMES